MQYIILFLLQYINTITFYLLIPRNIHIKNINDITNPIIFFYNMFSDIFIIVPIILGLIIAYIRVVLINLETWYRPKNKKKGRTPYGYINLATAITMFISKDGNLYNFRETLDLNEFFTPYEDVNTLYLYIITLTFIVYFINNYRYNFIKKENAKG